MSADLSVVIFYIDIAQRQCTHHLHWTLQGFFARVFLWLVFNFAMTFNAIFSGFFFGSNE